jgi:hypothetical protein
MEKFYDQLLPLFGFDLSLKEHDSSIEHEYQRRACLIPEAGDSELMDTL